MSEKGVADSRLTNVRATGGASEPGRIRAPHPAIAWIAAIGTGVLLALAYPPWNFGGVVWFALTPLAAVLAHGARRPFLLGYIAGLVFFTITFHWLYALGELFETPALYGLPLLLGAYLALYPAAWAWIFARLQPLTQLNSWRNLATGVLAASSWTLLEWIRGWFLSGFGWNGLAVALHRDVQVMQIAEVTGALGLTWLVVFVNVMAVVIVRRIAGEIGPGFMKRVRWEFSISVALVVFVIGYGWRQLLRTRPPADKLQVAAIQPNIPQTQKFDRAAEQETFTTLERLTLMASAMNPDVILWPEAATPRGIFSDQGSFDRFNQLRASVTQPMLIGTVEDDVSAGEHRAFNSAMLLPAGAAPWDQPAPTYRKIHLVPFGEYLPLRPLLNPILGALVPGDIEAGRDFTLFTLRDHRLAALICFEDTLGDLTRRFVRDGADVLVNMTNDGWFLRTVGSEQHLANSILRAVENRRPLVRCGNTGVTALVRPSGHVERWLDPHREGFSFKEVPVRNDAPLTFYSRHGDWLAWPCLAATLAALGMIFRRR